MLTSLLIQIQAKALERSNVVVQLMCLVTLSLKQTKTSTSHNRTEKSQQAGGRPVGYSNFCRHVRRQIKRKHKTTFVLSVLDWN